MISWCAEQYHQKTSRSARGGGGAIPWRIFSRPNLTKSQEASAVRAWRTRTQAPTGVHLLSSCGSLFQNGAAVSYPSYHSDVRRQACVYFPLANDQPQQCVRLTTAISASRIPPQHKTNEMDN